MTLDQLSAAATELLPCPFCGGEAVLDDIGDRTAFYSVGCNNNACKVEAAANMRSKEEAIHHWNQRTGQLAAVADDAVVRLTKEYRETMAHDVLHSWAKDMVSAIAAMKDTQPTLAAKGTGDE